MNLFTMLTVLLVALKLIGVTHYSWFVAFSPVLCVFVFMFVCFALAAFASGSATYHGRRY